MNIEAKSHESIRNQNLKLKKFLKATSQREEEEEKERKSKRRRKRKRKKETGAEMNKEREREIGMREKNVNTEKVMWKNEIN